MTPQPRNTEAGHVCFRGRQGNLCSRANKPWSCFLIAGDKAIRAFRRSLSRVMASRKPPDLRIAKMQAYAIAVLSCTLLVVALRIALNHGSPMKSDDARTLEFVVSKVPLNSLIEEARYFMTDRGFHCTDLKNQSFSGTAFIGFIPLISQKADFLWCDSGERFYFPLVSKRWQVIFVNEAGRVAGIAVSVGLTGV